MKVLTRILDGQAIDLNAIRDSTDFETWDYLNPEFETREMLTSRSQQQRDRPV